jgi:L-asparagine transporter-like permease
VVFTLSQLASLIRHGVSLWAGVRHSASLPIHAPANHESTDYVFQWAVVLPLELVVAGLTVGYWNPDINVAVWISLFLGLIVFINIFGAIGFAESEFWASCLKLAAVCIFMVVGLILGTSLLVPFPNQIKPLQEMTNKINADT